METLRNCVFLQNLHIRKLVEVSEFFAALVNTTISRLVTKEEIFGEAMLVTKLIFSLSLCSLFQLNLN